MDYSKEIKQALDKKAGQDYIAPPEIPENEILANDLSRDIAIICEIGWLKQEKLNAALLKFINKIRP